MKKIYVILRKYSEKERPGSSLKERVILYGWTNKKNVVNAFFGQRDRSKFILRKFNREELNDIFCENELYPESLIDYIELYSINSEDKIPFFTTKYELMSAEKKILRLFSDASKLVERDDGNTRLLNMYMNLSDNYKDALDYIGFRPPELDAIFDNASKDTEEELEDIIDCAYSEYPQELYEKMRELPGVDHLPQDYQKVIYSLEAFIKVLSEDM